MQPVLAQVRARASARARTTARVTCTTMTSFLQVTRKTTLNTPHSCSIYVYGRGVPSSNVMRTMRNLGYNYGAPLWTIFGDELSKCRSDVSAFDLRRSMCRLSKIDDRCVDLRGSMIDMSTFEDG